MKKMLAAMLSLSLAFASLTAFAESEIPVYIDGAKTEFDVEPFIEDGRTLVPMRKIFEELGCSVEYYIDYEGKQTIVARRVDDYIMLIIGDKDMTVNNDTVTLDVPAKIVNDRTFVPLRAVSEALNAKVEWTNETKTVNIWSLRGDHIVRCKTLSEYTDKYEISVCYPVIDNPENDSYIEVINAKFKGDAYTAFENEKAELAECAAQMNDFQGKLMFQKTFKVNCDANDIISISDFAYVDLGGVHPTSIMSSYNFDLKNYKELSLCEVFSITEEELEKLVYDSFKEKLKADGSFDDIWDAALKENAKNVNFYLTDTIATLYFNQYDVAPYASGMPSLDFVLEDETAGANNDLNEIITKTEVGTAGSSLKAIDSLKKIADWCNINNPEVKDIEKAIEPAAKADEFNEQLKLLCDTFKGIVKDGSGEENGLDGLSMAYLAKFVAAGDESINLVAPMPMEFNTEDAIYFAVIKDVKDNKIKADLMWENIYDAVEVSLLKKGDLIIADNGVLLVEKLEEITDGISINGGLENGGADLISNGGGTYVEALWDDDKAKTSFGEFTFDVAEDVYLIDKSDLEADVPTEINGLDGVLKACGEEEINYGTLKIRIEGGVIVQLNKFYHP